MPDPAQLAPIVAAGVAGVLAVALAVPVVFRWNLNHKALVPILHKLIRADDVDRAMKFCRAVDKSMLGRVLTPVFEAAATQPEAPLETLAAALRAGVAEWEVRLDRATWATVGVGLLAVLATVATGLVPEARTTAGWALGLGALSLSVWVGRTLFGLRTALQTLPVDIVVSLVGQATGHEPSAEDVIAAVIGAGGSTVH